MFGGRRFLRALACLVTALAVTAGACGDDGGDEDAERATVPTSESTTTTEATTTTEPSPEFEPLLADPALTPEQQVEAAYLYSWEIYLDAVGNGRTEYLEIAFAGRAFEIVTEDVERLVTDGHSGEGAPEHGVAGIVVEGSSATLVDEYVNHLTLVDASSREPLEPDPNELVLYQYSLELQGGTWRVTEIFD